MLNLLNQNLSVSNADQAAAVLSGAGSGVREQEPSVDFDRLGEISDHDSAVMRDLADLYLGQADAMRESLEAAIKAGSAKEAQFLAHRWSGASASCGMARLVPLLQQMELHAREGQLSGAGELFAVASEELERVRLSLATHLVCPPKLPAPTNLCQES